MEKVLKVLDNSAIGAIMSHAKSAYSLIKSGGGNGPRKPGNLYIKVPNPAATKDEDSIFTLQLRASNLRCARFLL